MIRPKTRVGRMSARYFFPVSAILILIGCGSPSRPFLYPADEEAEIRLICSQAYSGAEARHQTWGKKKALWLFISTDRVTIYFENDRTRGIPLTPDWSLAPGKEPCPV